MIVINECRISPDGKCLIIEASVDNLEYFDDISIDSIIVHTDKTFSESGPDENKAEFIYKVLTRDVKKNIKLSVTAKELGLSSLNDNIFFVYVFANGVPAIDTPCGMDNCYKMAVAVNWRPIYNMAMGYIKELDSQCSLPKGFMDMVLRLKAFDLSLRTGNFNMAVKQWKKFFTNKISVSTSKGCGCNGLN